MSARLVAVLADGRRVPYALMTDDWGPAPDGRRGVSDGAMHAWIARADAAARARLERAHGSAVDRVVVGEVDDG